MKRTLLLAFASILVAAFSARTGFDVAWNVIVDGDLE